MTKSSDLAILVKCGILVTLTCVYTYRLIPTTMKIYYIFLVVFSLHFYIYCICLHTFHNFIFKISLFLALGYFYSRHTGVSSIRVQINNYLGLLTYLPYIDLGLIYRAGATISSRWK